MSTHARAGALLALAIVLAIAGAARPAVAAPAPIDEEAHTIRGRVSGADGDPISEATVRLVELGRTALTDDDGDYALGEIPSGKYTVSVSAYGYAPQVQRATVGDADVTLDVALKPSVIELQALQVSASAEATSAFNSPQPVAQVGQEDLEGARPTSLGAALETIAGVRNNSSGPDAGKPVIRGLTNSRVLVVDDGQRLEHNQWGDDHFSSVEPAEAERIEVIRGPASVLYGSDALGGVVNVIPPDLPDAIGSAPFAHGSLTGGFLSGNRQADGALSLEGASGGFGFRASGETRRARDLHTADYVLWNSAFHNVDGSGTVGYRGTWGALTARYGYRNDELNLTDEDPAATGRAATDDHRAHVDLVLPLRSARLDWGVGYERNRRHEWEDALATGEAFGMRENAYTSEIKLHHPPLGALTGLIGLSGEYTDDANFGEEHLMPDSREGGVGLYAFEQTDVGRWNVSFGARYDYRRLDADADQILGNPATRRNWSSVTGNIGLLYHVTDPVAIVLNVGRGFRAPSGFDLFANGLHEATSTFERGNPNLSTESSINTDLRLRVNSTSAAAEIGGFVNLIRDFIYTVPSGEVDPESGFEIYDVTQGDAVLTGFEGQVEYHPARILHLEGTADYVYGQNTSMSEPLPSMPPFRATYTARLEGRSLGAISNAYFSIGGETNARQTRLNPAEEVFFGQAFDGEGYTPAAYTLINLASGFELPSVDGRTIRLDLRLRNAFDQAWSDYLSHLKTIALDPGAGRSLSVRVTAGF